MKHTSTPDEKSVDQFSPEGFKTRMANIFYSAGDDPEICHGKMDDLMCELLRHLGYGDGIDIFESAERWYA